MIFDEFAGWDTYHTKIKLPFLQDSSDELKTQFMLSDQLYVNAKVPTTNKVCLWLGANVMLEYDIGDAEVLLQKNLTTAETNLEDLSDDISFLRDQITTTEVSILFSLFRFYSTLDILIILMLEQKWRLIRNTF